MKKTQNREKGFTLIEIIVVMVIIGVLAAVVGTVIVRGVENYIFARNADQVSQKAQLAMARIKKELIDAKAISERSANAVQYEAADEIEYRIAKTGNAITMERITAPAIPPQTLIDDLAAYSTESFLTFTAYDGNTWNLEPQNNTVNQLAAIRVVLLLNFATGDTLRFEQAVNPRKGALRNEPALN